MQKAKAAVSDFMHKSGHHDTTVHETVAPSVQQETVKPHQHENITTAVDREVHQDHYHHTVQPVQDKEILPEQHHHNLGAVQHKEYDHRDHEGTKRNIATLQGGFKDDRVVHDTTHTQEAAPQVAGEHVHHHIHETIQPVVHKETVQPHVVHTTVPIHETHHNAAKHHDTSELAPVSMAEFKQKGGVLGGREERYDGFEGEPKNIGGTLAGLAKGGHTKKDSHHTEEGLRAQQQHQGSGLNPLDSKQPHSHSTGHSHDQHQHEYDQGRQHQQHTTPGSRTDGLGLGAGAGAGLGGRQYDQSSTSNTTGTGTSTGGATGTKPGLLQKLNPLKDSDGDGKKGFME